MSNYSTDFAALSQHPPPKGNGRPGRRQRHWGDACEMYFN